MIHDSWDSSGFVSAQAVLADAPHASATAATPRESRIARQLGGDWQRVGKSFPKTSPQGEDVGARGPRCATDARLQSFSDTSVGEWVTSLGASRAQSQPDEPLE